RWGRAGFAQVLQHIAELWKKDPQKVSSSAEQLSQALTKHFSETTRSESPSPSLLESGYHAYEESYESHWGGFASAPKFPMPVNHHFLLRYYLRAHQEKSLNMVTHTLLSMSHGGIHDHLGGGFHRYSTDEKWHIPHFEKMLYDNAQIAVNYIEAFQITQDGDLGRAAQGTLDYVMRDLSHPEGGFYSAEDADSEERDWRLEISRSPTPNPPASPAGRQPLTPEKKEGAFYVWEKQEILKILGNEAGAIFSYRYGVEPGGNAASDPQGEFKNKNILYLAHSVPETAKKFGKKEGEIQRLLKEAKQKLLEVRSRRPRPLRDDKILTSWNGLMISAFAKASQVFDDPEYLKTAEKAAQFIRTHLYDAPTQSLYHRWRDGERKISGIAEDYAFLTQGLLDLYEASFDHRWLDWAIEITDQQNKIFYDSKNGGFYATAQDHDKNLLWRTKETTDNVEPSANSISTLNLLRLAQFTDRRDYLQAAEKTLSLFAPQIKEQPRSLPQMMAALDFYLAQHQQIVIAGDPKSPDTHEMLRQVHRRFIHNKILILADGGKNQAALAQRLPFLKNIARIKGKTTAYVCINYACEMPTTSLKTLGEILDGKNPLH
ncbi:MAG: thioredoxin domain-containing protein, partial [Elusimicrobia bacterium]|nr:thioredoxin domain-containing protein [Elusimicrobiota bacterium]